MTLPRSRYVCDGDEGVYHCYSRCVRRAFLCGFDALTGDDFSHRKKWLVDRLKHLAGIFAVEVCAYAVMQNHYHSILRTRPDIVAKWSDQEVAARWLQLFPQKRLLKNSSILSNERQIQVLVACPERIVELRKRLCSLSWFMGRLNEFIARAANKEDHVKGRFWESRFKCQVLLDHAAVAACMVYVDLNPIRVGIAATPEESDFTSIQERIRTWQKERSNTASGPAQTSQNTSSNFSERDLLVQKKAGEISNPFPEHIAATNNSLDDMPFSASWLCPISSEYHRRGILQMTVTEYFNLVDESGRMTRSDNRVVIEARLEPILRRIGSNPNTWPETVSRFGSKFYLAAGLLSNLRGFADHLGRKWLKGISAAQTTFASSLL